MDHATSPRRFFAVLVGLFAALGLVLASLGIYGLIAYSVAGRTQEIGIRMALGATRERVQMGVIWETLRMALVGVALGTIASYAVARAITSILFDTEPGDPVTFLIMIHRSPRWPLSRATCLRGERPVLNQPWPSEAISV